MFKNKSIIIFGGTGSFGHAFLDRLISNKNIPKEIKIFSRDEKKQDDMRKLYKSPNIKFLIGDIRDYSAVFNATKNVNFAFQAAALKQVPSCEFYPMEAVKTNILGTENVLDSAINSKVKKVIVLSTDKAVYPINAMGISKAMMEKVSIQKSLTNKNTKINIVRYGNVIASRGSIVPLFVDQIINKKPLTVTDPNMTRFMMTLQDAVNLVLYAFKFGKSGEIFVQKAPSTDLKTLAEAVKNLFKTPKHPIHVIGTRHGEKLFEVLLSREEMSRARELEKYYSITPDLRDLNYEKFVEVGEKKISVSKEYNSHNTYHLNMQQTQKLLMKSNYVKRSIKGIYSQSED